MRIIFVHGYKASPSMNWFPWISRELRSRGFDVVVPELPDASAPDRDAWTKKLLEECAPLDAQTILVGHSLGGAAVLRLLEAAEARTTPHAVVLVATPWMIRDERFRGFFMSELDFEVLMWRASKFVVIHADDDAIIPAEHGRRYASALHARFISTQDGGHFQGSEYPILLEKILEVAAEAVVYAPGESLGNQFRDVQI